MSTLVRAEVALAKAEVTGEVKKGVQGSVFFIIALTVLLFSTFFFFSPPSCWTAVIPLGCSSSCSP